MDKIKELYSLEDQIINLYIELTNSDIYQNSNFMHQVMLKELRRLVEKENSILNTLTIEEITSYLKTPSNQNEVEIRLRNKLANHKEILEGNYITAGDLKLSKLPENTKFSINDCALAKLNIDIIKALKNKIYSLKPQCEKDTSFACALRYELKKSKIDFLYQSPTSEIIALYNETDIDKIPTLDLTIASPKLQRVKNTSVERFTSTLITSYIHSILRKLTDTSSLSNNPEDVFKYLVTVTQTEILLTYMDKDLLEVFLVYCNHNTNNQNKDSMEYIKKLIRSRM